MSVTQENRPQSPMEQYVGYHRTSLTEVLVLHLDSITEPDVSTNGCTVTFPWGTSTSDLSTEGSQTKFFTAQLQQHLNRTTLVLLEKHTGKWQKERGEIKISKISLYNMLNWDTSRQAVSVFWFNSHSVCELVCTYIARAGNYPTEMHLWWSVPETICSPQQ